MGKENRSGPLSNCMRLLGECAEKSGMAEEMKMKSEMAAAGTVSMTNN